MTRYERRRKEAKEGNATLVVMDYDKDIRAQKDRQNHTKNRFVWTCCQQEIDSLRAEKTRIEIEFIG